MRSLSPVLALTILVSGCSVEPTAELFNVSGAPVAVQTPLDDRGEVAGRLQLLPIAPGKSLKLGAFRLPPTADFSLAAGGCVYAYKLTSFDLEHIKAGGGGSYPIPLEIGRDLQIRLRPSKRPGAPAPAVFGFPRTPISKACGAAGKQP